MIVLRDPQATSQITDPYIRDLVALRWSQVLAGEPYDYDRHGYMVVVEPGDTVEQLEQEIGLPILHGLFDDVPFGHPDFTPCFEILEEHRYEQRTVSTKWSSSAMTMGLLPRSLCRPRRHPGRLAGYVSIIRNASRDL